MDVVLSSRVRQTPEEGRRTYRPKRCGNNNKDEDNSPKTLHKIILFGTNLTSLHKSSTEPIVDYLIRTEKSAILLKTLVEFISNSLIIAIEIKGLLAEFISIKRIDRMHPLERNKTPPSRKYIGYDIKLHLIVRLQFRGVWSHPFITITPRSTLYRIGSTHKGPIYG